MNRCFLWSAAAIALAASAASVRTSIAQAPVRWVPTGTANYVDGGNWAGGFAPEAFFDEIAVIETGGVATIGSGVAPPATGGLNLTNGGLTIASGGTFNVEVGSQGRAIGEVFVGPDGTLTVSGPSGDMNVAGNLILAGTLVTNISSQGNGFTALNAGGSVIAGGALITNFDFTPTAGESWDLITSTEGFRGEFDSVTINGAGELGVGQFFRFAEGTLFLEQGLVLNINRQSGLMSIQNPGGTPIIIDGYGIKSAVGSIDPSQFHGLEDQGVNGWQEIGILSTTGVAELYPQQGGSPIAAGSSTDLGNINVRAATPFGVSYEDHVFEYTLPDDDLLLQSVVVYEGDPTPNNLTLTIDPDTGDGEIINTSPFDVSLDAYSVRSTAGSLTPGGWTSLQDSGEQGGDWQEIPADANQLGELKFEGEITLAQGEGFVLGQIVNTALVGDEEDGDLLFKFLMPGELVAFTGAVVIGDVFIPDGGDRSEADFNDDGQVNGDDFLIWQAGFGQFNDGSATQDDGDADGNGIVNGDDFLVWQAQFGTGVGGLAAGGVPEPSALLLLAVSAVLVALRRSR